MLWCGWVGTFCLVVERRRCRAACVCVVGVVDDIRPCPRHDATASRPEIEQPNLAPPSARGCRVCSGCPAVREFARSLVRSLVLLRSGIQPCVHPPLHAGRKLTLACATLEAIHSLLQLLSQSLHRARTGHNCDELRLYYVCILAARARAASAL
jgi:hypothetical protein